MIGIDLVEISRIKEFVDDKSDELLLRVFTKKEVEYARASQHADQRFAARFATKEAFFKAFNFGIFNEIELDRAGKQPFITLYGETKEQWEKIGKPIIHVSVSHTKNYATAVVLRMS